MSSVILIGMCYAGKTTIGKLLGQRLKKTVLDSRDIFKHEYGVSENEYLQKHGKEQFSVAEEKSLLQDFENKVVSVGGSAIYYEKAMASLLCNRKYTIVWLDVPFDVIEKRKKLESWERPIVYPDGINTFEELYKERYKKYEKYHQVRISVSQYDTPMDVVEKIMQQISLQARF